MIKPDPASFVRSDARSVKRRGGFTLFELMLIVVIMAILSSTVIPVMNQSTQARQGASRDEVVRTFEFARGLAIAGGVPVGVLVDTNDNTMTVVTIDNAGGIATVTDPIDGGDKQVNLPDQYAGVTINSFENGDGQIGDGTVWFDFQAQPHTRDDATGVFDALFAQNATVTMSTGTLVIVHAGSGFVEDQQ